MSSSIDINQRMELETLDNLDKEQNSFLESTLGKVIDSSVDFGLRAILPNFIEDEVIEIKDTLVNEGLIDDVSSNIKNEFKNQNKNVENLNKYNNNWKESFEAKDFDKMEKYMKKINNLLTKTLPLENTIKNARTIENLHELIKNNGKSFELSDEEMQLAELLG